MNKIDDKTLASMRALVEYLHDDEQKNYEESNDIELEPEFGSTLDNEHMQTELEKLGHNHIFNDVVQVATFLDNFNHGEKNTPPLADVYNMTSPRGSEVPNQFVITTEWGTYFKSYQSIIAFIPRGEGKTVLDADKWDYSTTTGKYRNQFLNEGIEETRRKIKDGTYLLANLNK